MFRDRMTAIVAQQGHPLCVGIDPHLSAISGRFFEEFLSKHREETFLQEFGHALLDAALAGNIGIVKFQSAFFEACGLSGMRVLKELLQTAKEQGLMTVLDVKRGDISSTMRAYGEACFSQMGADAITVLPYMGLSCLDPLERWLAQGKGVFVVWVSSNQDAVWLQSKIQSELLDELKLWLGERELTGACGLVLGATKLDKLGQEDFEAACGFPLLMPGFGAQGAKQGRRYQVLNQKGAFIVPVSRGFSLFGLQERRQELADCMDWQDYRRLVERQIASERAKWIGQSSERV